MPRSVFFYQPIWAGPGGRLVWSILMLTIMLVWTMLLMKHPAIKSYKTGAGILILGMGAGSSLVALGKIADNTPLARDTLVPNGYIFLWIAAICGLWTLIMAINAKQLKLKFSRTNHVLGTIGLIVVFYLIGGFVHAVSILMAWCILATIIVSITIYIWSLPPRVEDSTWATAIAGALASFFMMAFIYAIIPHEWITFATSYLGFTKDVKASTGGEFIVNTWLGGHFWTSQTRIIPFEVTFEVWQDQATIFIYVIGATLNIKLFSAWQRRNEPVAKKAEIADEEKASSKFSRFGRPIKAMKTSKV